ncbi:DMT family transporter [Oceanicella actignis]|uniref:DMT family transporter n=1 Tax=Oceanicella actignis TaxID=1189325 RepID=UPI0011E73937|nr:DMT family transporter [Oceanicella actignis]TYO91394.1 EamA-like transporter family protein [Oceanicella actignis]
MNEEAPAPARMAVGYAAAAFAVLVWAGWIVATRQQVRGSAPLDIALVRYGVPALLLAPIWLRRGLLPAGERFWPLAVMTIGWGGPFVLLTAKGLETVPAALFGPMVPATLPLFVAAWDRFAEGRAIAPERALGLALILAAGALIVGPAALRGDAGFFAGAPFLLAAAAGWAAFTIAFRRTRLSGLEATAYVSLWSAPFLLAAAAAQGVGLGRLEAGQLALMVLVQGVLSGVGAVAGFGLAVRALGAARTSSLTSLVPALAAVGGWLLLGERVAPASWASVILACAGVALTNGAGAGLRRLARGR